MLNSSNDCSLRACHKVQCISFQHFGVTHIQLKLVPIPPTSPAPCPSPRDIQDHPSASQIINSHFIGQHFVNRVHSYLRKNKKNLIFNHKHNRKKKFINCTWKCVSIWALYLLTNGILIIIFACISKPTIMLHHTELTDANISDFIVGVPRLNLGQHTKKFFLDVSIIQDESITLFQNLGPHPTRTQSSRFILYIY